jgi:hypothetical protein
MTAALCSESGRLDPVELRLGLIPGPLHIEEGFTSQELFEISHHPAREVIRFFSSLPGASITRQDRLNREESYYNWEWRWQQDNRYLIIGMTLLNGLENPVWGGSPLKGMCLFTDLQNLWQRFHQTFPGTWLHDEGDLEMLTPQRLMEKHAWAGAPACRQFVRCL